jgi:hypothetical protein
MTIFSKLVYDVDNSYVDLLIRDVWGDGKAFELILTESSDFPEDDGEIDLYLTREDLQLVIDQLTEVLHKK